MGQTQELFLTMGPAATSRPQPVHAAGPGGAVLAAGHRAPERPPITPSWLRLLRRFLVFIAAGNLAWEIAQLPLYTIWYEGTPREIAFAVVHCTGGDVLIAGASLLLALLIAARPTWPDETYGRVAALTVAFAGPLHRVQ